MPPKMGKKVVAELRKRSEKGLAYAKQIMQTEKIEDPILQNALVHYLKHWKDFTHPGLFSMACEAVRGIPEKILLPQVAITMMAAAFDLHDDVIDKSKVKHKIPTVYGQFGAEIALLLGNAFLLEGFKLFANSIATLPNEKSRKAIENFKKLTFEVGNAHAIELGLKKRKIIEPCDYIRVVEMKAAGVELDMYMGALFGEGENSEIEILAKLGRIIGILGTLREEFIDMFEIEELHQRICVKDLPLPLLVAMQDQKTKRKVVRVISKPNITQGDVDNLVNTTLEAEPVVKLKEQMQFLIEQGLKVTNNLPKTEARSIIRQFLSFMLEDL